MKILDLASCLIKNVTQSKKFSIRCLNINVAEGKKRDMTWGSYQWIFKGLGFKLTIEQDREDAA